MNLDSLTAWIKGHRSVALGGGAVAGVAGLALLQRRKNKATATGSTAAAGTAGDAGGYAYGTAGLTGTPNTAGTDIQSAVQGQINDALGAFQDNVNAQLAAGMSSAPPAPKPAPPKPAAPKYSVLHPPPGTRWVKDESNHGVIFQLWPTDGKQHYVNHTQWLALGSPKLAPVRLSTAPIKPPPAARRPTPQPIIPKKKPKR